MSVNSKLIYPQLSYRITGLLFSVHNNLGRYSREKQCADALEHELQNTNVAYKREKPLPHESIEDKRTNIADFVIEDRIVVECKACEHITKDHYYQIQRYLQMSGYRLGLLVNFRNKHLKAKRIVKIGQGDN